MSDIVQIIGIYPSKELSKNTEDVLLYNRKYFLPDNGKKNILLRRLQNLFIKTESAPYPLIAKELKLTKTLKGYSETEDKGSILSLKKNFNTKARKTWKMILISTKGIPFDGLKLKLVNEKDKSASDIT